MLDLGLQHRGKGGRTLICLAFLLVEDFILFITLFPLNDFKYWPWLPLLATFKSGRKRSYSLQESHLLNNHAILKITGESIVFLIYYYYLFYLFI